MLILRICESYMAGRTLQTQSRCLRWVTVLNYRVELSSSQSSSQGGAEGSENICDRRKRGSESELEWTVRGAALLALKLEGGRKPRDADGLQEMKKARTQISPQSLVKECSPAHTVIWVQQKPISGFWPCLGLFVITAIGNSYDMQRIEKGR